MPGIGDNAEPVRRLIDRIVRLETEKKETAEAIKEVYLEAKSNGYDPRALKLLVREDMESAEKRAKREEIENAADVMRAALGAFGDTALGSAALERVGA